jgi:CDP-diacylglycerol--glycerol-3-phosphate 3-phosphatidyltransferase
MLKSNMMNVPNFLTLMRLALLPFMVVLFFLPFEWAAWTTLVLYVLGAITDWLDGWIARKFNEITDFGTMLDPISDKIFVVTVMLMLVATDRINGIMVLAVVLIIIREFAVSGLREFLGPKGISVPVSKLAKWKTAVQMAALALLIVSPFNMPAAVLGNMALLVATGLTLLTGWDYLKAGLDHIKKIA